MMSHIISIFLFLTISGSLAIFPYQYIPVGIQAPARQLIYNAPEGNIPQQQVLFYPEHRSSVSELYQPWIPYIQALQPSQNSYNIPAIQKYPSYPDYTNSYNTVAKFINYHRPLESVPSNAEEIETIPEPVMKDSDDTTEKQLLPEKISDLPNNINDDSICKEATTNTATSESESMSTEAMQLQDLQDSTTELIETPDESDATLSTNISVESTTAI